MCNFNSSEHIESSSQRSSPSSTRHQHPGAGHAAQRSGVSLTVIGYAVRPGLKPRHPSHNCLVLNMLARDRAQLQKHHTKSGLKKKKMGLNLNRHLSKKDTEMADKHMKRCSTLHVIREMQIQTALRHHDALMRTVQARSPDSSRCRQGCGASGSLPTAAGIQVVQPLWKPSGFLRNQGIQQCAPWYLTQRS